MIIWAVDFVTTKNGPQRLSSAFEERWKSD